MYLVSLKHKEEGKCEDQNYLDQNICYASDKAICLINRLSYV